MILIELLVVLGAIYLGARIGSIGIGFAGGLGVLVLTWASGCRSRATSWSPTSPGM